MKYLIMLTMILTMIGCTNDQEESKALIAKGKSLCCSQSGLWYMDGNMAHCNNGVNFFRVDEVVVIDNSCINK